MKNDTWEERRVLEQDERLSPTTDPRVEEAGRDQGPRLTKRDLAALRRIGEQYGLRFDQLQKFLAERSPEPGKLHGSLLSEEVTRRIIRRWKIEKLVHYKLFLFGEPGWIWLTRKGLQYVGLDFRYYDLRPTELQHLYYINQARAYVEQRRESDRWIAERFLRTEHEKQERGVSGEHRPDGVLIKPDGGRIAIEIELHVKSKARYASILGDIQPRYHRVWYFATAPVVEVLQEVMKSVLNENQRKTFQLLPIEERL